MGFSMVTINLRSMTYAWGNRQKCYKLLMYNPIIAVLVNFTVSFGLGVLSFKSYGLIIGALTSQISVLIHLLTKLRPMQSTYMFSDFLYVLKNFKDFPLYQMPTNLLRTIGTQYPILMMSTYFGSDFIGQYIMGQRLLYMPITLVGTALGQVHFKQATDIINQGKDVGELNYNTIKFILYLTFLPFLICTIFGTFIFKTFLGADWEMAGQIARIRSFEILFTAMFFSVSYIFVVIKRQRLYFFFYNNPNFQ